MARRPKSGRSVQGSQAVQRSVPKPGAARKQGPWPFVEESGGAVARHVAEAAGASVLRDDPRFDPRWDPRAAAIFDPRSDPRTDPRMVAKYDPRGNTRGDPRADPRANLQADTRGDDRGDTGADNRWDER